MEIKNYIKVLSRNKKALNDYEILEKYEAGIVLKGSEVKSARAGNIDIKGAFVKIIGGEPFIVGMKIAPYRFENIEKIDSTRARKLLLRKEEIKKLIGKSEQKGLTIIPLQVYIKGNWIKVEIALAKGRKAYEKKRAKIEKEIKREVDRELSKYN